MKAADTTRNSEGLYEKIKSMPKKKLYSLRINHMTTIFVPKEKCNEKYRQEYLQRAGLYSKARPAHHATCDDKIDKDELQKMLSAHMTTKEIAKHFGVSSTTINRYIKVNNLIK